MTWLQVKSHKTNCDLLEAFFFLLRPWKSFEECHQVGIVYDYDLFSQLENVALHSFDECDTNHTKKKKKKIK